MKAFLGQHMKWLLEVIFFCDQIPNHNIKYALALNICILHLQWPCISCFDPACHSDRDRWAPNLMAEQDWVENE